MQLTADHGAERDDEAIPAGRGDDEDGREGHEAGRRNGGGRGGYGGDTGGDGDSVAGADVASRGGVLGARCGRVPAGAVRGRGGQGVSGAGGVPPVLHGAEGLHRAGIRDDGGQDGVGCHPTELPLALVAIVPPRPHHRGHLAATIWNADHLHPS